MIWDLRLQKEEVLKMHYQVLFLLNLSFGLDYLALEALF